MGVTDTGVKSCNEPGCPCNCYYCQKYHNAGRATCVFGHASYCRTRMSAEERREAMYIAKHMKVG